MKILKKSCCLLLLIAFEIYYSQRHLNGENYGPVDVSLGLKCLMYGAIIWGVGMLIGFALKKSDKGTIEDGQGFLTFIVGLFCIGGGIIFVGGLIFMGFG